MVELVHRVRLKRVFYSIFLFTSTYYAKRIPCSYLLGSNCCGWDGVSSIPTAVFSLFANTTHPNLTEYGITGQVPSKIFHLFKLVSLYLEILHETNVSSKFDMPYQNPMYLSKFTRINGLVSFYIRSNKHVLDSAKKKTQKFISAKIIDSTASMLEHQYWWYQKFIVFYLTTSFYKILNISGFIFAFNTIK